MPDIIKKTWSSFKEKPDTWFFYLFLATSTFTIRKVLYFLSINNSFNEYTGVYIYLSDIFLILTFLFYILYNIKSILSNISSFLTLVISKIKLFHVEHLQRKNNSSENCSTWNNCKNIASNVPRGTLLLLCKSYTHLVNNYLIIFPLFAAFFSFLSILWTTNTGIAFFRSIKLLEYVLLYFYILTNVPRGTFSNFTTIPSKILNKMFHVEHPESNTNDNKILSTEKNVESKCSTWNIMQEKINVPRGTFMGNLFLITIIFGLIQAIIGITQFILQHSIGLFLFKESLLSQTIPGVAKVILNGDVYIRAYGLFPHPNIFGGYLVFSIIIALLIMKLFHVEQFNDKPICHPELVSGSKGDTEILKQVQNDINKNCSTWNNLANKLKSIVPRGTLLKIIVSIQCAALFLTFSKSAIFGLLIGLFYILYVSKNTNVPRGTSYKQIQATFKMFHVEHFKRKFIIMALISLSVFILLKPNINSLFIKSLQERNLYLNVSRGTFLEHPLLGIGAGQFVLNMSNNYKLEAWQYQPVHNVFLLILSEFGIFLLLGFIFFLFKLFHPSSNVPRGTYYEAGVEQLKQEGATQAILTIYLRGIFLSFIFIMLFDHYLWDIQQGSILLWSLLALLASIDNKRELN